MNELLILDGKLAANSYFEKLKERVLQLKKPPHLAVVLVGDNAESKVYIKHKQKKCAELGLGFSLFNIPADSTFDDQAKLIDGLNRNSDITGIILQSPI